MRCSKAEQLFQLYIDHRLPLSQMRALETHLSECANCCEDLRFLETLTSSLNVWQVVSEPEDMHEQIMQRIAASRRQANPVIYPQIKPFSPWRPSLVELLAAILLATIATLGTILEQPSLRAMLPIANGHDQLSIAFLNMVHTLTSMDSSTLGLLFWIAGSALGICITLAFAGADIRSRWFKAMMDRLPVR